MTHPSGTRRNRFVMWTPFRSLIDPLTRTLPDAYQACDQMLGAADDPSRADLVTVHRGRAVGLPPTLAAGTDPASTPAIPTDTQEETQ